MPIHPGSCPKEQRYERVLSHYICTIQHARPCVLEVKMSGRGATAILRLTDRSSCRVMRQTDVRLFRRPPGTWTTRCSKRAMKGINIQRCFPETLLSTTRICVCAAGNGSTLIARGLPTGRSTPTQPGRLGPQPPAPRSSTAASFLCSVPLPPPRARPTFARRSCVSSGSPP